MSYLFDEIYGKKEDAPAIEDKILLMGLQAAGKTAIKDVVFFNKSPDDMEDYMATVHYQRHFIDEEKSSMVIDSGGQESYWNEAVTHFRHLVFSNVKLLIWIVDVTHPEMFEESERRFSFTIRQYKKENPEGKITVLCHKVDLVPPEKMVVLHQHIRETFDDPRFEIDFENTSIYYGDSLKELIFTIMAEAGIDTKRFELISNLGQKVEESEEFQSYLMEHQEDPRIAQLLDYLKPEAEITLPTFGKLDLQFDLSDYEIVEIVLIDKNTFSPIVGASSKTSVTTQNSMDYLIALHEFKSHVKEHNVSLEQTGTILESKSGKVHGMVFNLAKNYLLITSFAEITEERKKLFFELIFKFAQSTDVSKKVPEAPPEPVQQTISVPEVSEIKMEHELKEKVVTEVPPIPPVQPSPPVESEAMEASSEVETTKEPAEIEVIDEPIEIAETEVPEIIEEFPSIEGEVPKVSEEISVEEITEKMDLPPSPAPVEMIVEDSVEVIETIEEVTQEIVTEPVPETEELPETHVESEPIVAEETPEVISEPVPDLPVPSVPSVPPVPPSPNDTSLQPTIEEGEQPVPEFVEKMVVEDLPSEQIAEEVKEPVQPTEPAEPVATLNGIGESGAIEFSADDIKNFASFLVQKKETILSDDFSTNDIKQISNFLTKPKEEESVEESSEDVE